MPTLSSLFQEQALRHADRIAVATPEARLTYGELDRLAGRVSGALRSRLGPGSEPVALLMDQDTSFMAAMLAILGAGKIFAPLDPVNPPGRLTAMLADLGARLVITDERHRALAAAVAGAQVPVTDVMSLANESPGDAPDGAGPTPDDLAWIIYTSGSTGQPKGVSQDHRRAAVMVREYARLARITHEDRLSLLHPFHTWDIFGALTSGAGLFAFDVRRHGLAGVGPWVRDQRLTVYRSFPTTYRRVIESLGDSVLDSVRLVHLSGEPVTASDTDLFRRHFGPACELLIIFGSNEAGLITSYRIGHETAAEVPVPVGFPLEGVELDLCDAAGNPVPAGTQGEIAVRSTQLFPGYWRNAALTDRVVRDPGTGGRARTFFSGDMGWLREDGCLFYAGRKDFQVKIGGYRIELAEIEGCLRAHAAVKETVVSAFDTAAGDARLVAYVATRDEGVRARELRQHLTERLPEYMQPDRYVFLAALPLTANGKVDRLALPPPDRTRPDLDTPFADPRTPLEHRLAELFAGALELDRVGLHDEFIELGGKSLAAVRILAAIARDHGVTIEPGAFFQASTVARVSQLLVERAAASAPPELVAALLDGLDALPDDEVERLLSPGGHGPGGEGP